MIIALLFFLSINMAFAAPASSGFDPMSLLPLVLIFIIFYFFLIRPQQKKARQHQQMITDLRRGDRVVTTGGMLGVIVKIIDDQEVQLEIAENVRVRFIKNMISDVLSKSETVA